MYTDKTASPDVSASEDPHRSRGDTRKDPQDANVRVHLALNSELLQTHRTLDSIPLHWGGGGRGGGYFNSKVAGGDDSSLYYLVSRLSFPAPIAYNIIVSALGKQSGQSHLFPVNG